MKPLYIYASRLRAFWVLIPMSIVLTLSLEFNSTSDGALKLYPLIIFSVGAIVFTFVYLFRFISISDSEIKYIGKFTSEDSAVINDGKTLEIEILEKRRVSIKLYGNEGYNPEIKWLTNENGEVDDICVFRGHVYGGKNIARMVLCYFGASREDIDASLEGEGFTKLYEGFELKSDTVYEHKRVQIKFNRDK